jgi:glutathione synthase/RimK-type ligase-like ATP-grasp enzyme
METMGGKMIYIYSSRDDQTTNNIIDWFCKYKIAYRRINSTDFLSFVNLNINQPKTKDVHWFWKWSALNFLQEKQYANLSNNQIIANALTEEYTKLFSSYFDNCSGRVINHPRFITIDKFSQLNIAQQCGLQIPATILTSHKETLSSFYHTYGKIITKNLTATPILHFNNKYYQTFTSIVTEQFIEQQASSFFPSLFQEAIEKEFELRIIYVGGQFFSCAIVNVNNSIIDSREAVNNKEAQIIPYKLPIEIEEKLDVFMQKINLQIGSIDMIYNKEKEYIFLEVNPSGQVMGYSEKCNYKIDKVIANYLINSNNGKD